jgi:hypothetical protein
MKRMIGAWVKDNVHFNGPGYKALAEQVGKVIEADLPAKK